MTIHGARYEDFNAFDTLSYQTSLMSFNDMTQELDMLNCHVLPYCVVTMSRAYTPLLYSINPQIVYKNSSVTFWIDPKQAQERRSTVFPELPFQKVLLNGYGVDFEATLDETSNM